MYNIVPLCHIPFQHLDMLSQCGQIQCYDDYHCESDAADAEYGTYTDGTQT